MPEAFVLVFGLSIAFVIAGVIGIVGDYLVNKWGGE
jgi:hypothetical protein